jgi:hypothetical protein
MSTAALTQNERLLHDTANAEFKAKYGKFIRWAFVLAVILHFTAFVFTPQFTITPYKLKQEQFEVVDIPDQIDLPPPPPDVPPPPVAVQAAEDDAEATDEVAETTFENFEDMPPPPPPSGGGGAEVFLAFDEPPQLIDYTSPEYPPLAREAGIEGTVAIRVLVSEEGAGRNGPAVRRHAGDGSGRGAGGSQMPLPPGQAAHGAGEGARHDSVPVQASRLGPGPARFIDPRSPGPRVFLSGGRPPGAIPPGLSCPRGRFARVPAAGSPSASPAARVGSAYRLHPARQPAFSPRRAPIRV